MTTTEFVIVNAQPRRQINQKAVLLVLKDRPEWQKGFLNLTGGRVEPGENPRETALRELKEETGLDQNPVTVPFQFPFESGKIICDTGEIIYCYNVPVDEHQPLKPREGETEKVCWCNWDIVKNDSRLVPSLRVILPLMREGIVGWEMHVTDTFMHKYHHTISLKVPSHLNRLFHRKDAVDNFIADPGLAISHAWNSMYQISKELHEDSPPNPRSQRGWFSWLFGK